MYKGKYEKTQPSGSAKASSVVVPQEKPTASAPRPEPRKAPPRKRNQGPTAGTYVFYGIYLAFVVVFFVVITIAMGALKDWLVSYQAAQPEAKSQQVFQQLFADPDWSSIYTLARPEDADSENKEAYAAFMREQIGDDELSFIETSAGLSGDRKYIVCHKDQGVAVFTLTADNKDAEIPDWRLGTVQIFFTRNLSFNIITMPGFTVTVNGTALDESHLIRTVSTKAEEYLPDGVQGYHLQEYRVTGLSAAPQVVITDKDGQTVETTFDAQTNTYTQVMPEAPEIAQDEYDVVLGAAKAYTEFMIKGGTAGLKKYFNTNSTIYKTIVGGMIIRQSYASYKYEQEVITDYYKYSDTLFSARIDLVTKVTRKDGTIKEFEVNTTFIYEKVNGKWVVYDMVNVDIQEKITQVRLTFKDAEGNVLSSEMVNADTKLLATPAVTVPEGQVFDGWYEETADEQGNTILNKAFQPDENGNVSLAGNNEGLKAMVLVPQFKEAG